MTPHHGPLQVGYRQNFISQTTFSLCLRPLPFPVLFFCYNVALHVINIDT